MWNLIFKKPAKGISSAGFIYLATNVNHIVLIVQKSFIVADYHHRTNLIKSLKNNTNNDN